MSVEAPGLGDSKRGDPTASADFMRATSSPVAMPLSPTPVGKEPTRENLLSDPESGSTPVATQVEPPTVSAGSPVIAPSSADIIFKPVPISAAGVDLSEKDRPTTKKTVEAISKGKEAADAEARVTGLHKSVTISPILTTFPGDEPSVGVGVDVGAGGAALSFSRGLPTVPDGSSTSAEVKSISDQGDQKNGNNMKNQKNKRTTTAKKRKRHHPMPWWYHPLGALLALLFAGVSAFTWIVCTFVASLASWHPNVKAGRLALSLTAAALTVPLWCATLFAGMRFLTREFGRPNAEKPHQQVYSKPSKPIAAKDEPVVHHDAMQSNLHRDLLPSETHEVDSRLGLVIVLQLVEALVEAWATVHTFLIINRQVAPSEFFILLSTQSTVFVCLWLAVNSSRYSLAVWRHLPAFVSASVYLLFAALLLWRQMALGWSAVDLCAPFFLDLSCWTNLAYVQTEPASTATPAVASSLVNNEDSTRIAERKSAVARVQEFVKHYAEVTSRGARYTCSFFKSLGKAIAVLVTIHIVFEVPMTDLWSTMGQALESATSAFAQNGLSAAVLVLPLLTVGLAWLLLGLCYHYFFVMASLFGGLALTFVWTFSNPFCNQVLFMHEQTEIRMPDCQAHTFADTTSKVLDYDYWIPQTLEADDATKRTDQFFRMALAIGTSVCVLMLGLATSYLHAFANSTLASEKSLYNRVLLPSFAPLNALLLNRRVVILSHTSLSPPETPVSKFLVRLEDNAAAAATATATSATAAARTEHHPGRKKNKTSDDSADLKSVVIGAVSAREGPRHSEHHSLAHSQTHYRHGKVAGRRDSPMLLPSSSLSLLTSSSSSSCIPPSLLLPRPTPVLLPQPQMGRAASSGSLPVPLKEDQIRKWMASSVAKEKRAVKDIIFFCATLYREDEKEVSFLLKSYQLNARSVPVRTKIEFHIVFDGVSEAMMAGTHENSIFLEYLDRAIHLHTGGGTASQRTSQQSQSRSHQSESRSHRSQSKSHQNRSTIRPFCSREARPTAYGWRHEEKNFAGGEASLFVHYKNPSKVRKRKRWSQVLYLFILQERLRDKRFLPPGFYRNRLDAHQHVYVMMTDGDVVFVDQTVKMMLDVARANPALAGVCARLKPEGSGLVAFVQQFEYAVAHWLLKTTESVLGSVLCASSCCSLFRFCALESVWDNFSVEATTAHEYQCLEQGEDRRLCTSLLKAGWGFKYCAGAVAKTFCPTSMDVYAIQRRRWMTSTDANTLALLQARGELLRKSEFINGGFMLYIFFGYVSSMLTPSSTMLILLGGWQIAFNSAAFFWPVCFGIFVPVGYGLFCMWAAPKGSVFLRRGQTAADRAAMLRDGQYGMLAFKNGREEIQLRAFAFLSAGYAIATGLAAIGIAAQIYSAWNSPSSIFLQFLIFIMLTTAALHGELRVLMSGILYFFNMVGQNVLLPMFVYANADVLDWGVRDGSGSAALFLGPLQRFWIAIVQIVRSLCVCVKAAAQADDQQSETQRKLSKATNSNKSESKAQEAKSNHQSETDPTDLKKEDLKKEDLKKEDLKEEDLKEEDLTKEDVKNEELKREAALSDSKKEADLTEYKDNTDLTDSKEEKKEKKKIAKPANYLALDWWVEEDDLPASEQRVVAMGPASKRLFLNPAQIMKPPLMDQVPSDVFEYRNRLMAVFFVVNLGWICTITLLTVHSNLLVLGTNVIGLLAVGFYAINLLVNYLCMLSDRAWTMCHFIASQSFRLKTHTTTIKS